MEKLLAPWRRRRRRRPHPSKSTARHGMPLKQKIEATKTFRRIIILGPSRFQDFLQLSGLSWNIQTSMGRYMADNDIREEDTKK
jgi:hypothetical protein